MRPDKQSQPVRLPERATTRDGVDWSPLKDEWKIPYTSGPVYFAFGKLKEITTENISESLKLLMINYLDLYSPKYALSLYELLYTLIKHTYRGLNIDLITAQDIVSYRITLNANTEYQLGSLRSMFLTWRDLGLPGLAPDVVPLLRRMRLKGNPKGVAVLTADPDKGPLTDVEFQAVTSALNDRFAGGAVNVGDYVLAWLFLAIGARPVQIAMLKASDLSVVRASDGTTAYILQVPRAKQRGAGPRSAFRPRKLIPAIGSLMERYVVGQRE